MIAWGTHAEDDHPKSGDTMTTLGQQMAGKATADHAGLTAEQATAVNGILGGLGSEQVQTLGGYAGTGKTTCLKALAAALPEFAVCAFTGKAAAVIRKRGADASTIHSGS
jgi:hypothetical protein